MKLAVVSHKPFFTTPEGPACRGGFARSIDALARHWDEVLVCVPVRPGRDGERGELLRDRRVRIRPLPFYERGGSVSNKASFLVHLPAMRAALARALDEADVVHPRIPGYVGLLGLRMARRRELPLFLWVGGDWDGKIVSVRDTPLRRLASGLAASVLKRSCRDSLAFTTGDDLRRKLASWGVRAVRTTASSLHRDEVLEPCDLDLAAPVRKLLFVGRLDPVKGLGHLLEALSIAREAGLDLELDVVGGGDDRPYRRRARALGIDGAVRWSGYVPRAGLPARIDEADVLVLPSLSEGTPKVLHEAMARGALVVASAVGGIPGIVEDGRCGLLVPPGRPDALVSALRRLVSEESLRARLRKEGLGEARRNTIESRTEELMSHVRRELLVGRAA